MLRYDPDHDAYVTLGVDPGASADEVEAAFRRSALTWHPDKSPAPDAAERFLDVQNAGMLLRDPESRRDYDFLRARHQNRSFRPPPPRSSPPPSSPGPSTSQSKPPPAYAPFPAPPPWLAPKVRIHMDGILITLQAVGKKPVAGRVFDLGAAVTLGGAIALGEMMLFALAAVLWAIGRVMHVPPQGGLLSWAKIVPGRKLAELHALDQRNQTYRRVDVAFQHLRIAVVPQGADFRVEIHGFPRAAAAPVLHRTRDLEEAHRCAREAGQYFSLPFGRAA